jgi:hypothetical protein
MCHHFSDRVRRGRPSNQAPKKLSISTPMSNPKIPISSNGLTLDSVKSGNYSPSTPTTFHEIILTSKFFSVFKPRKSKFHPPSKRNSLFFLSALIIRSRDPNTIEFSPFNCITSSKENHLSTLHSKHRAPKNNQSINHLCHATPQKQDKSVFLAFSRPIF